MPLMPCEEVGDLGVVIDNDLKLTAHINNTISSKAHIYEYIIK